jgi:hypothetical protein
MTLKPTDMLEIQSAIDDYERKFPRRAAPSAEVALAWRLGKREWKRRQAALRAAQKRDREVVRGGEEKGDPVITRQECSRWVWAGERFRVRWQTSHSSEDDTTRFEGLGPWVERALLVGWWGMFAVVVASVFFFGAIVGGFK